MANVLTDWRVALQNLLALTFPTAKLVTGERPQAGQGSTGISRDADKYSVFAGPLVPDSDVNDARPKMTIRYWKKDPKVGAVLATGNPTDPAPLEQLMLDLAAMLQPKLTSLGVSTLAYFHVDSITHDMEEYGVEVQMTGWMRNPAETGG